MPGTYSQIYIQIVFAVKHRTGIYLREAEKFLVLTFEKVRTMKEGDEKLSELSGVVFG